MLLQNKIRLSWLKTKNKNKKNIYNKKKIMIMMMMIDKILNKQKPEESKNF